MYEESDEKEGAKEKDRYQDTLSEIPYLHFIFIFIVITNEQRI